MQQLVNAFPEHLRKIVEEVLCIIPISNKIKSKHGGGLNVTTLTSDHSFTVVHKGEQLTIPIRVYFDEPKPDSENGLNTLQQTILNCIYLRHHNGFVRQKRLEKLITQTDDFIVPFTLQLLGEYVVEILEVLGKHINERTIATYKAYIEENPKYWQQTKDRMVSYWSAYYRFRKFLKLENYPGSELVKKLDTPKKKQTNDRTGL